MTDVFLLDCVTKTYISGFFRRRTTVLRSVNLRVEAGEAVGFIGHNGAGKSSTIRLMLGLQAPTSGHATIFGLPAQEPSARSGVGYLPEIPLLYDYLTPNELLRMALRLHGFRGDERAQIEKWLSRMNLTAAANVRVRGFSKGMSQRVALAMALCSDPKVLVLDEPLSGLDPLGRREVVEILEEYRQAGNTLFFSSHVLSDVERLADRFVFIHKGSIHCSYSVDSVLRAAAGVYELTVCGEAAGMGFVPAGRHLWRKQVAADDLSSELAKVSETGALLHSVRSASSIEELYVRLVGERGV